jgi:hypothetical protein
MQTLSVIELTAIQNQTAPALPAIDEWRFRARYRAQPFSFDSDKTGATVLGKPAV